MMKTKICYDYTAFSMQRYGGVTKYLAEIIKGLDKDFFDVNVDALFYINNYLRLASSSVCVKGSYVNSKSRFVGRLIREINNFSSAIISSKEKFGIVHETYYRKEPVIDGGVRILTVHDMIHELFPSDFKDAKNHSLMKRCSVQRADHIICVSNRTKNDLTEIFGVDERKISVIYHGYDMPPVIDCVNDNKYTGRPFVLYVGARGGYKNFGRFIKAFSASKFLMNNFNIVSFGGEAVSRSEQASIESYGLKNNIFFTGGSDHELSGLYKNASCFIYPSMYEGFGFPPLEAMSFGCPIICSSGGSIGEIVGNSALYFDPSNIEEIQMALETILESESIRNSLKINYSDTLKKYSWNKCVLETEMVYKSIS